LLSSTPFVSLTQNAKGPRSKYLCQGFDEWSPNESKPQLGYEHSFPVATAAAEHLSHWRIGHARFQVEQMT
jgi:hypothetical protein